MIPRIAGARTIPGFQGLLRLQDCHIDHRCDLPRNFQITDVLCILYICISYHLDL